MIDTMSYTVTKSPPMLVSPSASTPSGVLSFSALDRVSPFYMHFVSVYSHGEQPTARIKEAFSKALTHYYPVAGRMVKKNGTSEPVVDFTGEGIWYVEARANCSLADMNFFDGPLLISMEQMLPKPPAGMKLEEQILMAQVTEFTCSGFSVGICFNHFIYDGQGLAQFLKAVGEMARGMSKPTVKPVWSRETVQFPPDALQTWPVPTTDCNFPGFVLDISLDSINRTKDLFQNETGRKCSTFDVTTAMVFKARAKAINLASNDDVRLMYAASTRRFLEKMSPSMEGYYGNCVYLGDMTKKYEEISNASLVEVITFIQDSKGAISTNFMDWMNRIPVKYSNTASDYGILCISDWRMIGFDEIDYGWGEPKYVFTQDLDINIVSCVIYLNPPAPKQGVRMLLQCVKEEHVAEFRNELQKFQL